MTGDYIDILLNLLRAAGNRGLPLAAVRARLEQSLSDTGCTDSASLADETIERALDSWVIEKTIDEADDIDDPSKFGQVWYLRALTSEERKKLRNLPGIEKALLKILRDSEWNGRIGVIRECLVIERLRELGFDFENVTYTSEKIDVFVEIENGQPVRYHHLLSQYELSDEHKTMLEELSRSARKREGRLFHAREREVARQKRKVTGKKAS